MKDMEECDMHVCCHVISSLGSSVAVMLKYSKDNNVRNIYKSKLKAEDSRSVFGPTKCSTHPATLGRKPFCIEGVR